MVYTSTNEKQNDIENMRYTIRRMTVEDVEDVYSIETRGHIAPWSKKIIRDCVLVGYGCFVILRRKKIWGFMIARSSLGNCHLLNLCIDPDYQGKGCGEALLIYLIDFINPHCHTLSLEVRPSNIPAQKLYEKHHFKKTSEKKDYYTDPDGSHEDAIVLSLDLTKKHKKKK
jgi:ribosomal-protein-alanine N-acetyltransferase